MTSTEVATTVRAEVEAAKATSPLLLSPEQTEWSDRQLAAIRHMGAEGASPADLDIFLHICKRNGLDPFARDAYLITRMANEKTPGGWRKVPKSTIQTGIDGFRKMAHRAAVRNDSVWGYDEDPQWMGDDMKWVPVWRTPDTPPIAAKMVINRDGMRFPAVCNFHEFVQMKPAYDGGGDPNKATAARPNDMWSRMPANQLLKCAEAKALRMAFPNDLSGIYIDEEMPMVVDTEGNVLEGGGTRRRRAGAALRERVQPKQVEAAPATVDAAPEPEPVKPTPEQRAVLQELFVKLNVTDRLGEASRALDRKVEDSRTLTGAEVQVFIEYLQGQLAETVPIPEPRIEQRADVVDPTAKVDPHSPAFKLMMKLVRTVVPEQARQHTAVAAIVGLDELEHFDDLTVGAMHTVIEDLQEAADKLTAAKEAESGTQGE